MRNGLDFSLMTKELAAARPTGRPSAGTPSDRSHAFTLPSDPATSGPSLSSRASPVRAAPRHDRGADRQAPLHRAEPSDRTDPPRSDKAQPSKGLAARDDARHTDRATPDDRSLSPRTARRDDPPRRTDPPGRGRSERPDDASSEHGIAAPLDNDAEAKSGGEAQASGTTEGSQSDSAGTDDESEEHAAGDQQGNASPDATLPSAPQDGPPLQQGEAPPDPSAVGSALAATPATATLSAAAAAGAVSAEPPE